MKLVSILLLIGILSAQMWTSPGYIKDIDKCHICGKTIIQHIESHKYYDNPSMAIFGGGPPSWEIPDSSWTRKIEINKSIKVCPECYRLYDEKIILHIKTQWNRLIQIYKNENLDNRDFYTKQRYENKIKELDKKILDLIKKRDEEARSGTK